ncbi:MAG: lasso peptide biosynthesis B2 protein [Acidimicrobiales bacterium]|nr:lasso peptide biosynthesis B2 protein [Acidimicrobiales bacterium]
MARPDLQTRLVRLSRLAAAEPHAVVAGVLVLPILNLAKRTGRKRLASRIERWLRGSQNPEPRTTAVAESKRVGEAIAVGAKLWRLSDSSCVARSALAHALLVRRGIDAQIRVGLAPNRTTAHAWVEVEGVPIDDAPDVARRYLAFDQNLPTAFSKKAEPER